MSFLTFFLEVKIRLNHSISFKNKLVNKVTLLSSLKVLLSKGVLRSTGSVLFSKQQTYFEFLTFFL